MGNDPYPEKDGIDIGLATGHLVHAKTILYLFYELGLITPFSLFWHEHGGITPVTYASFLPTSYFIYRCLDRASMIVW